VDTLSAPLAGGGTVNFWMRLFIVSETYTDPSGATAMPIGRLKSPLPLPVLPHAPVSLPSL
jgi:hypothetical protein